MTSYMVGSRNVVTPNWTNRVLAALMAVAVVSFFAVGPANAQCGPHKADLAPNAIEHFQATKAAAIGADKQAQVELARLYKSGHGVKPDLVRAYAWYNVAARVVLDASSERDQLSQCLDPGQQVKAQLLSLELLTSVSSR